jgi:hypothetical protein
MSFKARLFWILWVPGMAGVLSFLLVDLSALIAAMPQTSGEPVALPPPALLKLVSIIQPAALMTLTVLVCVWLANRVGLHSPAAEAFSRGEGFFSKLKPQIVPGVLAGLASGIAIVLIWVIAKPFLTPEFISRAEEFNKFIPHAVRLFYGGFTEELLLRWGVMTFLIWASWRLLVRTGNDSAPASAFFIGAIVVSALLFGIGHLPVASALSGGLTIPLAIFVITGNSLFGLVAGFLYWKRGLESAIIAHMSAHLVLITAIYLSF